MPNGVINSLKFSAPHEATAPSQAPVQHSFSSARTGVDRYDLSRLPILQDKQS